MRFVHEKLGFCRAARCATPTKSLFQSLIKQLEQTSSAEIKVDYYLLLPELRLREPLPKLFLDGLV